MQINIPEDKSGIPKVTPRELSIIKDAAEGLTIKATAAKYGVSPRTVHSHRCRILKKTGCANMIEVVFQYTLLGIIA